MDNTLIPDWYISATTAFFVLSLGVNAVTTALIVYRIMTVYNSLRGFNVNSSSYGNGQHNLNLNTLISILIESGLITFVAQLAQSILYGYEPAHEGTSLVSGCVVMLYVRLPLFWLSYSHLLFTQGISTAIVVVRVEMGISYGHNTTRTVNSVNLGRPIQFTSNINQTTIIDIAVDGPHDAHSEKELMSNWYTFLNPSIHLTSHACMHCTAALNINMLCTYVTSSL